MEQKELSEQDKSKLVEDIVNRWNSLVEGVQNLTISLCLYIKESMKDYPSESIKEVMDRVKKHPNIKKFVSTDRIWQGMRLLERRPDVIEYMLSPEQVKQDRFDEEKTPILKKDGEVFIEAYFELEKSPLPRNERDILEIDARENNWSYRELKEAIRKRTDELKNPGSDWTELRLQRDSLISQIITVVKSMPIEKLPNVLKILESYKKQNENDLS